MMSRVRQDASATDTFSFDERTNDFLARIDAKDSRLSINKDYETNSSSSRVHSSHSGITTPPLSRGSLRSHIPVRDKDRRKRSSRTSKEESLPSLSDHVMSPSDSGVREEEEQKLLHGKLSYPVFQRPRFPGVKRVLGQYALEIQESKVNTVDTSMNEQQEKKPDGNGETKYVGADDEVETPKSYRRINDLNTLKETNSQSHMLRRVSSSNHAVSNGKAECVDDDSQSRSSARSGSDVMADKHLVKVKVDIHNVSENVLSNSSTPRLKSLPPLRGSDTMKPRLNSGDSCHLKSDRLLSPLALLDKKGATMNILQSYCESPRDVSYRCEVASTYALWSCETDHNPRSDGNGNTPNETSHSLLSSKPEHEKSSIIDVYDVSPESQQSRVNPAVHHQLPADPRRALSEGDFSPRSSSGRATPSSVSSRPGSSARMRRRASQEKSPPSSISTARSWQQSAKSVLNGTAPLNSVQRIGNDVDRESDVTLDDLESELDKTLKLLNCDQNTGHKNDFQSNDISIESETNLSLEELEKELDKTLDDLERERDLSKLLKDSVMNMNILDDDVIREQKIDESLNEMRGDTDKILGELLEMTDMGPDIVPDRASRTNYDDILPSYRSENSSENSEKSDAVSKLRADIALYTERTTKSEYMNSVSPSRTKRKVNSENALSGSQSDRAVIIRSSRRPQSTSPTKVHKTLKNVGKSHSRTVPSTPRINLSGDLEESEDRTKSEELAATYFGERNLNHQDDSEESNEKDSHIRNHKISDYTSSVRSEPIIDLEVNDSKYYPNRSSHPNVMYEEVSAVDSHISKHPREPTVKRSQRNHGDDHTSVIDGVAHDETENMSKLIDHQLQLRTSNQQTESRSARRAVQSSRDDTNQQSRTSKSHQQSPTGDQTSLITSEVRHTLNDDFGDSIKQPIKDDIKSQRSKTNGQKHNSPSKPTEVEPRPTIELDQIDRDIEMLTSRSAEQLANKYKQQSRPMTPVDLIMSKHAGVQSRYTSPPISVTKLFEASSSRSKNALETSKLVSEQTRTNTNKVDVPTSRISKSANGRLADVQPTGFTQPVVSQSVRIDLKRNPRLDGCSPPLSEPLFRHDVNVFYAKNHERAPSGSLPKASPRCPLENHWFVGQIEGRANEKSGVHWSRSTQFASHTSVVTTAKAQADWCGDRDVRRDDVVLLFDEDDQVLELVKTKEGLEAERERIAGESDTVCDSESMMTSFSLSVETVPEDEQQCSCFKRFLDTLLLFFFAKRN